MITKNMNAILFRRKKQFMVGNTEAVVTSEQNMQLMYVLTEELKRLGFRMSTDLTNALLGKHTADIQMLSESLVDFCRENRGERENMTPLFHNFSTAEFPENLSIRVFQYAYVDLKDDPEAMDALIERYGDELFKEELENVLVDSSLERIDLGTEADYINVCKQLISSKVSYSSQDQSDIDVILSELSLVRSGIRIDELMPETLDIKENIAYITSTLVKEYGYDNVKNIVSKYFKTYTDVLRYAVALSNGDVSLTRSSKFRNFKRHERRMLLDMFNKLGTNNYEDLLRHKSMFLRLGEKIHPGEYKTRYANTFKCFDGLRNNAKNLQSKTFNSRKERAFKNKDIHTVLKLLEQRPGEFARSLNRVLLLAEEIEYNTNAVIQCFVKAAYNNVPISTLLTIANYFENRSSNNNLRVFYPKGQMAKLYARENNLEDLDIDTLVSVSELLSDLMNSMLAEKTDLGKVYIDPEIRQYVAPLKLRDMSKTSKPVERGSKFDITSDNIRFYCHWLNAVVDEREWRTDLDLSIGMYNEDFKMVDHVSFFKTQAEGCQHSGDFTDAPHNKGGATEYVDIKLDKVRKDARYIVVTVHSFSSQPFYQLPEAFVGYIEIPEGATIASYEPSLAKVKLDLTSEERSTIPCVIDVKTKKLVWADLGSGINDYSRTVLDNKSRTTVILEGLVKTTKPNLYELVSMNAHARGKIVDDIKEADIIFISDKDKLDDNDTVRNRIVEKVIQSVDEDGNTIEETVEDIETYEAQVVTPYDTAYITSELL